MRNLAHDGESETEERDVATRRGGWLEFLGLTLAAGVGVLAVVHPEWYDGLLYWLLNDVSPAVH